MSKADAYVQAGKTAVLQNVHGTLQFLQRFAPFSQMEQAHLVYLVEQCHLRFYASGESILKPDEGPVEHFYIVKQGRVVGERPRIAGGGNETTFEIASGECFPLAALLGERATRTKHLAGDDTFCLRLPKASFIHLFALSAPFRDFALRGVSSLLDQVNQQVRRQAAETLGSQYSLNARLGDLALRHPVSCDSTLPVRLAVKAMHEQQVGSIVVVDAEQAPVGIFTLRDLRELAAESDADFNQPIAERMVTAPFTLSPDATAFEAALAMTERHIAHVCLVKDGRLCGVISERDLFSLQRVDLVHLARAIRTAPTLDSLTAIRQDIGPLVERMLAFGASSIQITRIVTLLNDHSVCRVIELTVAAYGDPGVPFSWLSFGSEGRHEQTLYTDQDNGLLFEADDAVHAAELRGKLLPLAHQINQALAHCGFALCAGNVMAGNPELCLSRAEWSRRFAAFVRETTPENLLASSIFFDLRTVWGDPDPGYWLQQRLLAQVADNGIFQRMMASNALRQRPPVGRFREFVLARKGSERTATLDLKTQGLGPFVDGARLLALANGISATPTVERLRQLAQRGIIDAQDSAAYEEAYAFIQQLRLQHHQAQSREHLPWSNRLDPDTLNQLDRRILRESLRQAQRLQGSLAARYQL
ncbi:putative nucleotidyltransferase substrate binding domain-containing protein [Pseudomonas japonica]|uniref:putative nucleotidyltransferase substrate binding domain-containing protein n=1 Tax=Pseudomonas japonica TaxID=256466 RepID=UPI0015E3D845|nr:putative nucleotidyltransferase substrate binding domain-containing protein [Pseudomonas japonica]MBA1242993.1 CBS domain-containing protein [Pseudomonas japonica]